MPLRLSSSALALVLCFAASCPVSCATPPPVTDGSSSVAHTAERSAAAASGAASTSVDSPAPGSPALHASAQRKAAADAKRFADLVNDLSEPDTYFFSDNLVTNETSYLQVAKELEASAPPGGVYLGVGPEQNFSYVAIARPSMAFIVDIRRANMLLHLLYRAAFEQASSRAHFVALLLGRAHDAQATNAPDADVEAVLDAAVRGAATEDTFETAHAVLMRRVRSYGVKLSAEDKAGLQKMHRAFFADQLGIRFELHAQNGRTYPTLRELLKTRSPGDESGSFLATEEAFRYVQTMQKGGRIVPIVGDFAGDKAIPQLSAYLRSEGKSVGVFYVSNVEQYLLAPKTFEKWVRNVRGLPKTDKSLFLRAYLDQGRKHPSQMQGHRTASVLSRMVDFETSFGEKPTATFWALCTENLLAGR